MKTLFIAEKPELAEAISLGFGEKVTRRNGYFEVGNNLIPWSYGHILELAYPEFYDEKYKKWTLEDLPLEIDINDFKYLPIESSEKQLNIIVELINSKEVGTIVNCGDADEEGQILIDEILNYANNTKPVKRLLISDLTEKSVKKALDNLQSNDDFKGLSDGGFARSQGDYLYGINLTRAYTKLAQLKGYEGVLSVGRVQTPILGLVVARDKEHESHTSNYYYSVSSIFSFKGFDFKANLKINEAITIEDEAIIIKETCLNKEGLITKAINEDKFETPPLPYNLIDLQSECSNKFGYSADKTLEITQELRTKHKLITYNRSDCNYLPENLFEEAPGILEAIKSNIDTFSTAIDGTDSSIKSLAWNDKNLTAHHGIMPTTQKVNINDLSKDELNIYQLICKSFIAQFYKNKELVHTQIEITICNYIFATSTKETTSKGFEVLFEKEKESKKEDIEEIEEEQIKGLELLELGETVDCNEVNIVKNSTKPKPFYTLATLLKDLTSVAKYVKNPEIKKLLIEKDRGKKGENGGIGTPATRSAHLKNLFAKGYLVEENKKIKSTTTGKKLIELSPTSLTTPDMTALWFEQQKDIVEGKLTKEEFLLSLEKEIEEEIKRAKESDKFSSISLNENSIECPICKKGILQRKKSFKDKKTSYWWGCSAYSDGCKASFQDNKGKPILIKKELSKEHQCPSCDDGFLIRRKTIKDKKTSYWWGCSEFSKGCKYTAFDNKGKPKSK